MKKSLLAALAPVFVVTSSLHAQTTTPPPIPEEARRHFVMGTALFKDAKTHDDYVEVESEFKQAADLAPQWPDPRYNLALTKEAAGDFSGAMADLKLYQQFKLSDEDARKVQDKIYVLEARQRKATEEANSPAAQLERLVKSLDGGVWRCVRAVRDIPPGQFPSYPRGTFGRDGNHYEYPECTSYIAVRGHTISGYSYSNIRVFDPNSKPTWTATLTGPTFHPPYLAIDSSDYSEQSHEATFSIDGQSITERDAGTMQNLRQTRTLTYTRIQ